MLVATSNRTSKKPMAATVPRLSDGCSRPALLVTCAAVGLALALACCSATAGCMSSTCHPMRGFHSGSGLICRECHSMHYSEDGAKPAEADAGGPFKHLLIKQPTDLCMQCHKAPDGPGPIVLTTAGDMGTNYPLLPGGDFYYAKTSNDPNKGHNPGGALIGFDPTLSQAPGSTFESNRSTCGKCHDPHGTQADSNSYRLLLKKPGDWTGSDLLVSGKESHPGHSETDNFKGKLNKAGYYSGFSEWCGACHSNPDDQGTGFHGAAKSDSDVGDGTDWIRHPCDKALGSTIAAQYGTTYTLPYHVEDVNQDDLVDANDEVFCLSCHRAHATEYANATRWDCTQPSGTGSGCNKCHAKGE